MYDKALRIHCRDKCMVQQGRIAKIAYKRQTTELSLFFVLVWMMFLVPVITEKALALTDAVAYAPAFTEFSNVRGHMDDGKFVSGPTLSGDRKIIFWTTAGTGFFGGDEKGYVQADVTGYGIVKFDFFNPASGRNTCSVVAPITLQAECTITQGISAYAKYTLVRH
jgi:hypothetical protein